MTPGVRRTVAIAHKEVLHMIRDPRVVYLALGLPIVMLLLFGYAISTDVDHIPIAVVDQDQTRASRRLTEAMVAGESFVVRARLPAPDRAEPLLRRGEITAVLVIPRGYQRDLWRGGGAAQLLVDGSDGTVGTIALGDALGAAQRIAPGAAGLRVAPLVARFNPAMRSAYNIVPGVIALILSMVSSLLTALAVAREWERGSMEQLFATPVGRAEIILGKLIPYAVLGVIQTLLIVTLGSWMFDVPIRGSLAVLLAGSLLFLLAMLGTGLYVSVATKSQLVSVQITFMISMLPTTLLSGFMFPIANMPWPLRALAAVLPGRYYIAILRGVLLKGEGFGALAAAFVALTVFAAAVTALAVARFHRRLS
ncbi:MAG TPA: ABC transporter permease [Kofleriaceae bacterium]|nr:ABC transporter permease [Kofleriaceae bacterium]